MWIKNNNKWEIQKDTLNKSVYNEIRQPLEDIRFFQKCLKGTTYSKISNLNNVYNIKNIYSDKSWYVNSTYSPLPLEANEEINQSNITQWNKINSEYNLTLKDSYTPNNEVYKSTTIDVVDLATTEEVDINNIFTELIIDGIRVINGHKILVKNQRTTVTLLNTVDPNTFFNSNFQILDSNSINTTYDFANSENGIYTYTDGRLIKTLLIEYKDVMNLSISVKLGNSNSNSNFNLDKLKNNLYPIEGENFSFSNVDNYLIRNEFEYQNVLDNNIKDTLYHTEEFIGNFQITERYISVGEFGTIIITQNGVSNIIDLKLKKDLNKITSTKNYYWIVGEQGYLFKLNKITFEITSYKLPSYHSLNDIEFFNEDTAVIVGDRNKIFYTINSGDSWNDISNSEYEEFDFKKVIFNSIHSFDVVSSIGTVLNFKISNSIWTVSKYSLKITESSFDEFNVISNITDIKSINLDSWGIVDNLILPQPIIKTGKILCGSDNTIIIYDTNFINFDNIIIRINKNEVEDIINFVINDTEVFISTISGVYSFDLNDYLLFNNNSNVIESNSPVSQIYNNTVYNISLKGNSEIITNEANLNVNILDVNSSNTIPLVSSTFKNSLISKLLLLDYEIASKVNFYGDDLTYRLPNSISIIEPLNDLIFSNNNWILYDRDINKTYVYDPNMITVSYIEYNINFNISTVNEFTIPNTNVTNTEIETEEIKNLQTPTNTKEFFTFGKFSAIKLPTNITMNVGDVIKISSNLIDNNFIVNRIENLGGDDYIFLITNFNDTLIEDLILNSGLITIRNLNQYTDKTNLQENINYHYIGKSYNYINDDIISKQSNDNTYYSLSNTVLSDGIATTIEYPNTFSNFGYTPEYNIKDFLFNIDPIFLPTKEFELMPIYNNIPIINSHIIISDNKLSFNSSLKFEFDNLMINTFIDLQVTNLHEKFLIINKYYDSESDRYIVDLHKNIPETSGSLNIISRRTLEQISSDLNEVNNIQRNININGTFGNTYTKEITFKFNTDSYAKIFLADKDVKEKLTGILYQDYDNNLSVNILNLNTTIDISINEIYAIPITNGIVKSQVNTTMPHGLSIGQGIIIKMDNSIDDNYSGFFTVENILDDFNFVIDKLYTTNATIGSFTKSDSNDSYYKYYPSDIMEIGHDYSIKKSKLIEFEDLIIDNSVFNIKPYSELTKNKFILKDGLTLEHIYSNYNWLIEAEIEEAEVKLGLDNQIIWENGTWICGRWFNGTFEKGTWLDGEWYNGIFGLMEAKWFNGNFRGGTWINGKWFGGTFIDGTWENGTWFNGTWQNGIWENGIWKSGIWIDGIFTGGKFDSSNGKSTWINGSFKNSIFESGTWIDGNMFNSQFGLGSSNTNKAIIESGVITNSTISSNLFNDETHKYTIIKTADIINSTINSGVLFSVNITNSKWENGILDYFDIMSYDNINFIIKINKSLEFNPNYKIRIFNTESKEYLEMLVKDYTKTDINTEIELYKDISSILNIDMTKNKLVGILENSLWENGLMKNGIFKDNQFNGGIVIDGLIESGSWL